MRADGWMGIPLYDTSVLVRDLAAMLDCPFEGDGGRDISTAAPLDSATADALSFAVAARLRMRPVHRARVA